MWMHEYKSLCYVHTGTLVCIHIINTLCTCARGKVISSVWQQCRHEHKKNQILKNRHWTVLYATKWSNVMQNYLMFA